MYFLLGYLHQLIDTALSFLRLIQNREIGWLTIVRETGEFKREQQPLWKKFKLLLLFNPLTEWLDQTHLFRLYTHEKNIEAGLSNAPVYPMIILTTFRTGGSSGTVAQADQKLH